MVFQSVNPQIYHILENSQVTRMRMPMHNQRNVVSVKQVKQIVGFLKVEIAGVTLRSVFLEKISVREHYDVPVSLT